jgi:hypothetical protein
MGVDPLEAPDRGGQGVDRAGQPLTARHKSENPCDSMGLSQWGGQGAMGAWGCETNPIPRGSPDPAPS